MPMQRGVTTSINKIIIGEYFVIDVVANNTYICPLVRALLDSEIYCMDFEEIVIIDTYTSYPIKR